MNILWTILNAAEIMGAPPPGYSSGQAIKAIEEVMKTMPSEVGYEWSGLTLQEKKSEERARMRSCSSDPCPRICCLRSTQFRRARPLFRRA